MQKCILIIDNAKEYLDFLSSNLSKEGYRVITAGNGSSALELIKQKTLEMEQSQAFELPEAEVQDIDTESDWLIAEIKHRCMIR